MKKRQKKASRKKSSKKGKERHSAKGWPNSERFAELYPTASWETLRKEFPGKTEAAMRSKAGRMGISRPRLQGDASPIPRKARNVWKEVDVTEDQLAEFMTRGRSVQEVAVKFNLPMDTVQCLLEAGFKRYDLVCPALHNLQGETTYVAIPANDTVKVPERVWAWEHGSNPEQPYGAAIFSEDYRHKKIRVIPLDSVMYGDPQHDAVRFDNVLSDISRKPNTFCFLNGDIIAPMTGIKKKDKDRVHNERCIELEKKLRKVAHKILWAQQGCTEERARKSEQLDPLEYVCDRFGIPYFKEPVYVDIHAWGHVFTFWAIHGRSNSRFPGTKINALRHPAGSLDYADFTVMGHVKHAMSNKVTRIRRDPVHCRIREVECFHLILPSFTKYWGTTDAKKGNRPGSHHTMACYMFPDGGTVVKAISTTRRS